jgi:dUTP pyrophosphatase
MTSELLFERLPHNTDLPLPSYETAHAAGMDVRAAVDTDLTIEPGKWGLVPTGLKVAVPAGYEMQVRPRSGLAFKKGITVLNAPGTIDADYRGELKILLVNFGNEPFVIQRGDRIAQLIIAAVQQFSVREVAKLDDTTRAEGGFGSTGVR